MIGKMIDRNFWTKTLTLLLAIGFMCAASGCSKEEMNAIIDQIKQTNLGAAPSSAPENAQFELSDLNDRVTAAQTQFALNLFHAVHNNADPADNLFLSPYSIAAALAMTANGAADETLTEMQQTLQMHGLSLEEMNRGYQVLTDLLAHSGEEVKVSIANSLWAREGLSFHDAFLENVRTYYDAEVTSLNFQSDAAANRINAWVHKQTRGKIPSIIDGPIPGDAILYLLNAIYFEANWAKPFREEATKTKPFALPDGSKKEVPMMVNSGQFQYLEGDGFQAIRLPYQGHRMSMLVFLPDQNSNLEQLISKLTADQWKEWLDSFARASGALEMPRFKLEFETSLKETLEQMGMKTAFHPQAAQFSNMISLYENVYLKDAKHKAYIEVEEKGTVAAAVTSIEAGAASAPAKTFQMIVDRPFFFAIHDQGTDAILFMGTVTNP